MGSRARFGDINPVYGPLVDADVDSWIVCAFRFVSRSTMTWQQVTRIGFDEVIMGVVEAMKKAADEPY